MRLNGVEPSRPVRGTRPSKRFDDCLQPPGAPLLSCEGVNAFERFLDTDISPWLAAFLARRMAVVRHLWMTLGVEAVTEGDVADLAVVGVAGQPVAVLPVGRNPNEWRDDPPLGLVRLKGPPRSIR